jgi:Flp pilus assembly protein TadG
MRRLRVIVLSLCGVIALVIAAINPLMLILSVTSIATLSLMLRWLNVLRITMTLKRFIQTANQLRAKLRANIRMGFRDYSGIAVENEESNLKNSHCGYMR